MALDSGEPFGLPRGTVRGIIALASAGSILGSFVVTGDCPIALLAFGGPFVGYYFGTRAGEPAAIVAEPLAAPAVAGEPAE